MALILRAVSLVRRTTRPSVTRRSNSRAQSSMWSSLVGAIKPLSQWTEKLLGNKKTQIRIHFFRIAYLCLNLSENQTILLFDRKHWSAVRKMIWIEWSLLIICKSPKFKTRGWSSVVLSLWVEKNSTDLIREGGGGAVRCTGRVSVDLCTCIQKGILCMQSSIHFKASRAECPMSYLLFNPSSSRNTDTTTKNWISEASTNLCWSKWKERGVSDSMYRF